MPISGLRITNAGPFDDITFEFDKQVNVFVGPNNSGKSTTLLVLAEIAVFPVWFPEKLLKGAESQWHVTLMDSQQKWQSEGVIPIDLSSNQGAMDLLRKVGFTTFIPALRRSTDYRSKGPAILAEQQELHFGDPELRKRQNLIATDAELVSDESVIRKMIDLDYTAYRLNQPHVRQVIDKVAGVASEITEGFPIEFLGIGQDERGLFPEFRTPDGDLPFNVLSQGTQSIIQWLSHFLFGYAQYYDYPQSLVEKPAILIIDEIDAHLHPSWQRRIIPALTGNFPNLQIFCSTHSPLMLAGLAEGQVQLLSRDLGGNVTVSRNETDMIGWSAEEILSHVQGVRNPTDLAASIDLDRLGELISKTTLTDEETAELEELRHRVGQAVSAGPAAAQVEFLFKQVKQIYSRPKSDSELPARTRPRVRRRDSEPS